MGNLFSLGGVIGAFMALIVLLKIPDLLITASGLTGVGVQVLTLAVGVSLTAIGFALMKDFMRVLSKPSLGTLGYALIGVGVLLYGLGQVASLGMASAAGTLFGFAGLTAGLGLLGELGETALVVGLKR